MKKSKKKPKKKKVPLGKSVSFHDLNHFSDEKNMPTLHNKVRKRIHSIDEESVAPLLDKVLLKCQKIQDNIPNNHLSNTEEMVKTL